MKKYKGSGWYNESRRHSLASKGIKTSKKKHNPNLVGAGALIGTGLGFVGGGPVGAISGGIVGTTAGVGAEVLSESFRNNKNNKKTKNNKKVNYSTGSGINVTKSDILDITRRRKEHDDIKKVVRLMNKEDLDKFSKNVRKELTFDDYENSVFRVLYRDFLHNENWLRKKGIDIEFPTVYLY